MIPIQEKIKECTEEIFTKLQNYNFKRKHSPDHPNPPKTRPRARWTNPNQDLAPISCPSCTTYRSTIEKLHRKLTDHQDTLYLLLSEKQNLQDKLSESEEIRKFLNQKLQETKGPIRVCCRVKPAIASCIEYPDKGTSGKCQMVQISKNSAKSVYLFDRVFDEGGCQDDIYSEVQSYIQTTVDGGKVCIFSYGQTGSGKTYTLEGKDLNDRLNESSGILPRAAYHIFSEISRQSVVNAQVFISCAEVYMDTISDLLSDTKTTSKTMENVTWHQVVSLPELLKHICEASHKRVTRDTHLNQTSSRSHTIYQIRIEGTLQSKEIRGKLSVIDLAGSERANMEPFSSKSSEEVENMKKVMEEGKFINKSLSCLKRVFTALGNKNALAPYRESKLTKVLQDQLQAGVIIVFVTVSPENYSESQESLKFGSTVQNAKFN